MQKHRGFDCDVSKLQNMFQNFKNDMDILWLATLYLFVLTKFSSYVWQTFPN